MRACLRCLFQLRLRREVHRGPLVIVTEAAGGAARLVRGMPLLAEFPLCEVPPHSNDSVYPSLSWQPKATRRAIMRLAAAAPWFKVRAACFLCPGTQPRASGWQRNNRAEHAASGMSGSSWRSMSTCAQATRARENTTSHSLACAYSPASIKSFPLCAGLGPAGALWASACGQPGRRLAPGHCGRALRALPARRWAPSLDH